MSALMSGPVFVRSVAARRVTVLVTTAGLALMLLLTVWIYKGMNTDIYAAMPDGLRRAMGIPTGADPAVLGFSVVLGTMGSLTLGGVAIAMGHSLLNGEESGGTLRLLLSTPISRRTTVVTKELALVILVAVTTLVTWMLAAMVPPVLGVAAGQAHLAALCLHLGLNTAFYGFLAFTIGAWTGRGGAAAGIASLVMVLSFITVGLLPLFERTRGLVGWIPWNWFNGNSPLVNGVNVLDVVRLATGIVLFAILAVIGFTRRDLVSAETGTTVLDRLRRHPMTQRLGDRLGGQARVSTLTSKLATEQQGLLNVINGVMFTYLGLLIGVLYSTMGDVVKAEGDVLTPQMLAMFGGAPMNTPEGFYQSETLGLMLPIALIWVGTAMAVNGVAGHERAGRLGLVLGMPVSRTDWLGSVTSVVVMRVMLVAVTTGLGIAGGSLIGRLHLNPAHIAAAMLHAAALGLLYSAIALLLAAATGRTTVATWGTVGLAVVGHFWNAIFSTSETLHGWARLSPFHYYLTGNPLAQGADWGHVGVLLVGAALLGALAFPLFNRRDLRG